MQPKTTYNNSYTYGSTRPHAPTKIGVQNLAYDGDGNQTASTGTFEVGREVTWNELDQLTKEVDSSFTNTFIYNSAGERTHKRRTSLETVYVNPYYVIRSLLFQTKHIYAGPTRILSATVTLNDFRKLTTTQTPILFYYHSDQLGSASYITDRTGQILEHEEYLPSGESWIEELKNGNGTNRLPWQFNAKELDETGLYYYGARYYNPRAGVWMSPDPAFGGGVGEPGHLGLYTYAANNPLNVGDPSGLEDVPINKAPSGALPDARFFADASKSGGLVPFNDTSSFESAAKGHQIYRYDPEHGFDPATATSMGGLREALGGGNDIWKGVVAVAGLANGSASASDVRTDGTGSSGGIPGGHCESCSGSTAAQIAYVAATIGPAIIGGLISAGEKAAISETESALHHVFPQQFAPEFEQILGPGGESIHDFALKIPRSLHESIHPEWNRQWEDFLFSAERNGFPSPKQVKHFATELIYEHGLEQYLPFVPFR